MAAKSFFPGSNTCRGFHGYFDELLPREETQRAYMIKGGPGVGKSTLMKRLGAAWEKQGRDVEYYWCSGDPQSLDAVIADGRMLMDGTAPHVIDPTLPGAADGIVNLGVCLNETVMAVHREEALRLGSEISRCYARAYRYLSGADAAWRDSAAIYQQAVDYGALINLRMELMHYLQGAPGRTQRLYAQSITCKGVMSHVQSLVCEDMICLDLPFGFDADCILRPLSLHLSAQGAGYRAFMQALDGKRHAHIVSGERAVVTFVEKGKPVRTLPFDEHILRREHDALAFNRAAYDLMLRQAVESLHTANEKHDALERLYMDAMDYRRLEEMAESVMETMLS